MQNRWRIDGEAIVWDVTDKSEHIDDIEMTDLGASVVYQLRKTVCSTVREAAGFTHRRSAMTRWSMRRRGSAIRRS